MKKKLTYKYVIGVRWNDGCEKLLGAKDIDALMELVLGWLTQDKKIESWTAMEFSEARKLKLTKFVDEVCLGSAPKKRKAKKK